MRPILLISALFMVSTMTQASPLVETGDNQNSQHTVVAERLASKNLTEIVVIAMQLQMECQKLNSQDVCGGVKNILAVLDKRLASLPAASDETSIAFVKGLMEGVNDANQAVIAQLAEAP
jgi:hypothetical protein